MSSASQPSSEVTREGVLELMKSRDSIDAEIEALGGILAANHVGMTESLTDAEGFPRNDIDVYQVRHARHRIICLQNDRKSLSQLIERQLFVLHERRGTNEGDSTPMDTSTSVRSNNMPPIARVNLVSDGSPAFQAGVRVDDLILSVGSINYRNFTGLTDIGNLVTRSKGTVVHVAVKRNGTVVKLTLIPGPWSGNGLIGCNILPIENIDR